MSRVREVVDRDFAVVPDRPATCLKHRGIDLLERPLDCHLCAHDLREALRHALVTNRWLHEWRTDMLTALDEVRV